MRRMRLPSETGRAPVWQARVTSSLEYPPSGPMNTPILLWTSGFDSTLLRVDCSSFSQGIRQT